MVDLFFSLGCIYLLFHFCIVQASSLYSKYVYVPFRACHCSVTSRKNIYLDNPGTLSSYLFVILILSNSFLSVMYRPILLLNLFIFYYFIRKYVFLFIFNGFMFTRPLISIITTSSIRNTTKLVSAQSLYLSDWHDLFGFHGSLTYCDFFNYFCFYFFSLRC